MQLSDGLYRVSVSVCCLTWISSGSSVTAPPTPHRCCSLAHMLPSDILLISTPVCNFQPVSHKFCGCMCTWLLAAKAVRNDSWQLSVTVSHNNHILDFYHNNLHTHIQQHYKTAQLFFTVFLLPGNIFFFIQSMLSEQL